MLKNLITDTPTNPGKPTNSGTPAEPVLLNFTDVAAKYRESVTYLITENIFMGMTKTKFGTHQPIKRADAAVMLAKALRLDTKTAPDSGFTDVPSRAAGYVNALKAAGYVKGKTATSLGAHDNITRGEMALILTAAFKLNGEGQDMSFTDVNDRDKESVASLVKFRITQGIRY